MINKAREITNDTFISYIKKPIEDFVFTKYHFDVIMSSLAFHYIESFKLICEKVYDSLKVDGTFVFSVEHPIFTSRKEQDWHYDNNGNRLHWPVDHYQKEGVRETLYLNDLLNSGFVVNTVKESFPSDEMLKYDSQMEDENRRPMFLMISASK